MTNKIKNKKTLQRLYNHFDKTGFCTSIDEECELLYVHHGLCIINIERNNFFDISFEVNCDPTASAHVMKEIIEFANKNKFKVDIFEPYAYVINEENDTIQEMLFGDDAIEYHETGEVPIKEKKIEKEDEVIDPQKRIDSILDQINKKGIKSLKKNQKEFLLKYSKDNHDKHNHSHNNNNSQNDGQVS